MIPNIVISFLHTSRQSDLLYLGWLLFHRRSLFFCSNVCQWLLVSLKDPDGQIVSMDAVIAKRGNQSSFYCSNQNIIALSTSFPTTKLRISSTFWITSTFQIETWVGYSWIPFAKKIRSKTQFSEIFFNSELRNNGLAVGAAAYRKKTFSVCGFLAQFSQHHYQKSDWI